MGLDELSQEWLDSAMQLSAVFDEIDSLIAIRDVRLFLAVPMETGIFNKPKPAFPSLS